MDTNHSSAVDRFLTTLSEVVKLKLYLFTLAVQAVTAGVVRWGLVLLLWTVLGWFVDLPVSSTVAGAVCMFGPLAWSASAFWLPGSGKIWGKLCGAFDPSLEEARLIDAAFGSFDPRVVEELREIHIQVVDSNAKFAFVRGKTLIISRGLVEDPAFPGVLIHELWHLSTTDGRLMQALDRLVLWRDPLKRDPDRGPWWEHGWVGPICELLRWALRIAGGDWTLRLPFMSAAWASYRRERERLADVYTVQWGYGPVLARHLKNWRLPSERPHPRLLFNLQTHDRVAYRLDILRKELPRAEFS